MLDVMQSGARLTPTGGTDHMVLAYIFGDGPARC